MILFFVVLSGAVFASFISTAAYRVPRGISIVLPFSECGYCHKRLKGYDLIPVLSYILLGGRCRYCGNKIPPRYFVAEVILPGCWLFIYLKFGISILTFVYLSSSLLLLYLSLIDIDIGLLALWEILLMYIISGAYVFFILKGYLPGYLKENLWGLTAGAGVVGLSFGIVYLLKRRVPMGGGDLLLLPALSIFFNVERVLIMLVLTGVLGVSMSMFLLLSGKVKRNQKFPFIPYLTAGFFLEVLLF